MRITLCGAGEIGRQFAQTLSTRGHDVTIIERGRSLCDELNERLDSKIVHGDGATVESLVAADLHECELFLSLTASDTTNLVSASLAKTLGAGRTVARVSQRRYAEQWLLSYKNQFHVDHLFCPEQLTAVEIAKHIRNPNRVAVEELCNGRIELQQGRVSPESRMCGRSLPEVSLPDRVRIAFIQRDGALFVPDATDTLQPEDVVTLFGSPSKLSSALSSVQATPEAREPENVIILGGGAHGAALAQRLQAPRRRIRIMERDPEACERLANNLVRCVVLNVNATSMRELREEQVGDVDYFVAVTGEDEDNVMLCLQAQSLGARHTIALVGRADFAEALSSRSEQLGITATVSPQAITNRELLRFVTAERFHEVVSLSGSMDVLGIPVSSGSPLAKRTIQSLPRLRGAILVAITRGSEVFVPAAEDVIEVGDTVYALVTHDARKAFVKRMIR